MLICITNLYIIIYYYMIRELRTLRHNRVIYYMFSSSHTAYYLSPHRAHVCTRYTLYYITPTCGVLYTVHDFPARARACVGSLTSVHTRASLGGS